MRLRLALLSPLLATSLLAQAPAPAAPGQPAPGGPPNLGQPPAAPAVPATPAEPPPPFVAQPALGGLRFDNPVAIVTPPGETNRVFIVEKSGRIIVVPDTAKPERVTFLDITAKVGNANGEEGLLALAFHPDYRRNRQFYVWFTLSTTTAAGTGRHNRLARFTASATDPNQADPASEQPLITQQDQAGNHNGGEIQFGPDGYLYLTVGDEGGANDTYQNSQRIDRDFFAGLLRLDVDKKPGSLPPNPHPAVHEGTYTVPRDNPWVGATAFNGQPVEPTAVRTEFWAVGLRNAWRFSFDPATGALWLADVGQDRLEEVNVIRKGGNYGWNYREADQIFYPAQRGGGGRGRGRGQAAAPAAPVTPPPPPAAPTPFRTTPPGLTFDEPVFSYFHTAAAPAGTRDVGDSITGGIVYRGTALPALAGRYLFADYNSGRIWALSRIELDKDGRALGPVTAELVARRGGIVTFAQDPRTGDLLLANISSGNIERLAANPAAAPKP
jgi:glucose/arabinose dehydrogenase